MGLFDKLKSLVSDDKKDTGTIEIIAPLSGEIVNIEDVPDVVFAEKIVGDGIAIKPTGNKMVAPVDGTIGKIFETNHAFSIESDSGVELFVHFGIDTVELKGRRPSSVLLKKVSGVKVGDTVIEFDLPLLEEKAKSTLTPVVISNMDEIKELIKLSGSVTVGETPLSASRSNSCRSEKWRPCGAIFYASASGGKINSSLSMLLVLAHHFQYAHPARCTASFNAFPFSKPLIS
ncbi:glucose-specific PTS system EIIA component [Escherichia coli]|uniref:PTS system glucose-specific EIIA component n=1 Tax=Escherichia coli TaxID=562 RepID=A0A2X3JCX8_ECOLX|nr:glucose-specific PTS system EIIA component [Escherichia coli]